MQLGVCGFSCGVKSGFGSERAAATLAARRAEVLPTTDPWKNSHEERRGGCFPECEPLHFIKGNKDICSRRKIRRRVSGGFAEAAEVEFSMKQSCDYSYNKQHWSTGIDCHPRRHGSSWKLCPAGRV